ncbi:MAG: YceD family protein, partial [Gammaproteobacteria bacterium]
FMSSRLPELIVPCTLTEQRARLVGILDLGRMKRLSSSLYRATGTVAVDLQFSKDEHGNRLVTGGWSTRLWLICQRCVEPMEIALSRELRLELVRGTQEWGMSLDFEPIQVSESERVSLLEMLEDELILALPMAPVHVIGDCRGIDTGPAVENQNPFGVLAKTD